MAQVDLQDRPLRDEETLRAHLEALVRLDPRLGPVLEQAGQVPLRLGRPGFAGLARIVSSQMLSVASASTIHERVEKLVGEMCAENFLRTDPEALRKAGLSRSKITSMRAVAMAEMRGEIDFDLLHRLEPSGVMEKLTSIKGIGPWSAEIYLVFCIAHPDIFPAGDLVLQKMLGKVLGRRKKPDEKATRRLAGKWSPYRGSAARLLWRYFAVLRDREGINL